jgi:hypothetical protein
MEVSISQMEGRGEKNLEPDSLRAAVGTQFVEGLWDNESGRTKHSPPGVNQLKCLISAIKASPSTTFFID